MRRSALAFSLLAVVSCVQVALAADAGASKNRDEQVLSRAVVSTPPANAKGQRRPRSVQVECGYDENGDPIPCNDDPGNGSGTASCLKCVIGLDGNSYCKDPNVYTVAQGDILSPCQAVTLCYWLGYWYCYPTCNGARCQYV